jgi:vitamin B12 transporter
MGRRHKSKPGDLPDGNFCSMLRVESREWVRQSILFSFHFLLLLFNLKTLKMQKGKLIFKMSVMLGLTFFHVNAQEILDTSKINPIDEVIITATRSEKKTFDVGRSVTVINKDDIKDSGTNSLAELLTMQQGIFVVGGQQNFGSLSNIFMRGANTNQTVIMIDGMRITDPSSTNNSVDVSELSLENVDRIEIVSGSHSTLYGSSAIGGVINIISKKNYSVPGVHVNTQIKGGAFNKYGTVFSQNALLNYTHKSGIYLTAEIYNIGCKGFNSTIDTVTNPKIYKFPDQSNPFRKTDLMGKLGYNVKKIDIFASYKLADQHTSIDAEVFHDDNNYIIDFNRGLLNYGAIYKFNNRVSVMYFGGISNIERKAINDSSQVNPFGLTDHNYSSGTYKGNINSNDLQLNFRSKGIDLVAGGNFYQESMTSETYYYSSAFGIYELRTNLDTLGIEAQTASAFIHTDLNGSLWNEKLSSFNLALGGRFVNHNNFGKMFTYDINPSLKLTKDVLLYLSYTTGFNAPSLYQLNAPDKDIYSGITRGNETLKPERSNSFEIGIKQQFDHWFSYSLVYFNTKIENVVDYVYLWNKSKPVDSLSFLDYRGDTYVNLGTQDSYGFEFTFLSKIAEKVFLSGNLTLVGGQIKYNPSGIDTTHTKDNQIQLYTNGAFVNKEVKSIGLSRRPSTARLSFTYIPAKFLSLRMDARYAGARKDVYYDSSLGPYGALNTTDIKEYLLFDFFAKFNLIKGLDAMFRVENILNTDYSEIRGYATRGRGFYGGLRYSF